jgi:hypothetical protein
MSGDAARKSDGAEKIAGRALLVSIGRLNSSLRRRSWPTN